MTVPLRARCVKEALNAWWDFMPKTCFSTVTQNPVYFGLHVLLCEAIMDEFNVQPRAQGLVLHSAREADWEEDAAGQPAMTRSMLFEMLVQSAEVRFKFKAAALQPEAVAIFLKAMLEKVQGLEDVENMIGVKMHAGTLEDGWRLQGPGLYPTLRHPGHGKPYTELPSSELLRDQQPVTPECLEWTLASADSSAVASTDEIMLNGGLHAADTAGQDQHTANPHCSPKGCGSLAEKIAGSRLGSASVLRLSLAGGTCVPTATLPYPLKVPTIAAAASEPRELGTTDKDKSGALADKASMEHRFASIKQINQQDGLFPLERLGGAPDTAASPPSTDMALMPTNDWVGDRICSSAPRQEEAPAESIERLDMWPCLASRLLKLGGVQCRLSEDPASAPGPKLLRPVAAPPRDMANRERMEHLGGRQRSRHCPRQPNPSEAVSVFVASANLFDTAHGRPTRTADRGWRPGNISRLRPMMGGAKAAGNKQSRSISLPVLGTEMERPAVLRLEDEISKAASLRAQVHLKTQLRPGFRHIASASKLHSTAYPAGKGPKPLSLDSLTNHFPWVHNLNSDADEIISCSTMPEKLQLRTPSCDSRTRASHGGKPQLHHYLGPLRKGNAGGMEGKSRDGIRHMPRPPAPCECALQDQQRGASAAYQSPMTAPEERRHPPGTTPQKKSSQPRPILCGIAY
eukprot:CAMPEP_0117682524 /NCGR_PEP_ID=MMETSP0804-20121206/19718_1 /TAXON_ID=1074897 /ORGANISM="Tetraselmis astigmatica, Strain CCMP880" /LENGTH=686 /DNA_ID=CAMNT_0005492667 /DNA_START=887 /DNA_END=2946 /DNA_ORIENTATION=-